MLQSFVAIASGASLASTAAQFVAMSKDLEFSSN
jgi:hypothetical protein